MLQIIQKLAASTCVDNCAQTDFLPVAVVDVDFKGEQKNVNITLRGVIAGASVAALNEFLKNVSCFPGNRWTLQMKDLRIVSERGLRKLVRFASILRRRGFALEIQEIHQNIYAILQDLNLVQHFGWAD